MEQLIWNNSSKFLLGDHQYHSFYESKGLSIPIYLFLWNEIDGFSWIVSTNIEGIRAYKTGVSKTIEIAQKDAELKLNQEFVSRKSV